MNFKSIASPGPSEGSRTGTKKLTVPNQSMSIQEILERFTRGEPVAIGKDAQYDDGPDDLEKVAHMDLVDREEYMDRLKQTQNEYKAQQAKKAKAEKARVEAEYKAELKADAEKKAAEKGAKAE